MMQSDPKSQQPPQTPHRYDGVAKVTGKAKYAAEFSEPFPKSQLLYAYVVQATIPAGSVKAMDIARAERASGVVAVLTPFNSPKLSVGAPQPPAKRSLTVLQNPDIGYSGQPIGVVIAKSLPEAKYAARLIDISYNEQPAKLDFMGRLDEARPPKSAGKEPAKQSRTDTEAAFTQAAATVENTYITPIQVHNPMEPHATIAMWDGDHLTVYDATQYVIGDRDTVAKTLDVPPENVHLLSYFIGGGFGCKGSVWSHVPLAAMAARVVGRPVKLVLTRRQMFGPVGGRPLTEQRIALGARRDGTLTAIRHESTSHTSQFEDFLEPAAMQSRMLYASPNIATAHRLVKLDLGTPTFQRAPGEATGTFALESAMDELAVALGVDPVALRLKNYAETDPEKGLPWSSKSLRE